SSSPTSRRSSARTARAVGRSAGVVLALYLVTVAVFADMYITQPLLPQLARDFGVDAATAGLTLSAVVLTTALASSAYGPLSDVLGRRPIMVGGAFALALATLACGFAPSLGALVGLRAAQGALVPAVSALAVAYIADELSGDAGLVIGGYMASSIVGGLVGRIGSGVLAGAYDWRAPSAARALPARPRALVRSDAAPRARRPSRGRVRDRRRALLRLHRHLHVPAVRADGTAVRSVDRGRRLDLSRLPRGRRGFADRRAAHGLRPAPAADRARHRRRDRGNA